MSVAGRSICVVLYLLVGVARRCMHVRMPGQEYVNVQPRNSYIWMQNSVTKMLWQ
jgi:hypothetical protein